MSGVGNATTNVASHSEIAFADVSQGNTGQFIVSRVCLAGAPLFEGRWIPDSGEIISSRSAHECDWIVDLKEEA